MANDDHDRDIPSPDAPADSSERARAESFARRVESLLEGEATPSLMASDERELLEVATMLRAGHGEVPLDEGRRDAIVDDVLGQRRPGNEASGDARGASGVVAIDRHGPRRRRAARALPWSLATVAAAAAIVLALVRPQPNETVIVEERVEVPETHRSRSADPLVGRISRAEAGAASERIEVIHADRLDGFRERRFGWNGGER